MEKKKKSHMGIIMIPIFIALISCIFLFAWMCDGNDIVEASTATVEEEKQKEELLLELELIEEQLSDMDGNITSYGEILDQSGKLSQTVEGKFLNIEKELEDNREELYRLYQNEMQDGQEQLKENLIKITEDLERLRGEMAANRQDIFTALLSISQNHTEQWEENGERMKEIRSSFL